MQCIIYMIYKNFVNQIQDVVLDKEEQLALVSRDRHFVLYSRILGAICLLGRVALNNERRRGRILI